MRLRDRDLHLIDGRDAVIDADHDAREIGIRENRDGNVERQIDAHRDQREDDEDDRFAVARGPMFAVGTVGGGSGASLISLSRPSSAPEPLQAGLRHLRLERWAAPL